MKVIEFPNKKRIPPEVWEARLVAQNETINKILYTIGTLNAELIGAMQKYLRILQEFSTKVEPEEFTNFLTKYGDMHDLDVTPLNDIILQYEFDFN